MAYANSLVFYGWLESEALDTVNFILGKNTCATLDMLYKNRKDIEEKINKKINNDKTKMMIGKFDGGMSSDEKYIYLHIGKVLNSQSCGDDDIDKNSYTLDELKFFRYVVFN